MERVALTVALLLGMPVSISEAAPLLHGAAWAPAAPPTRVLSPPPPRLVAPPLRLEPRQTTNVPPPPEPVAPAPPPSEAPAAPPPSEAPPPTVPATEPSTTEPTTTEPTATGSTATEPGATEPGATEPTPTVTRPTVVVEPEPPELLPRPPLVVQPPQSLVMHDPPPPPGTGRKVGGGILIGLGTFNTLVGGIVTAATEDEDRALGIVRLTLGIVELGSGIVLVAQGVGRARRLAAWKAERSVGVPKTGNGMIVGGAVLVAGGLLDGLSAAVFVQQTGEVPGGTIAIAITEVVAGAVLLAVGSTRKRRYQAWEKRSFGAAPLPGGMALAMRGHF
jgi:hypothetical protein